MATITLTFMSPINISCKVGDVAYHTLASSQGGFSVDNNMFIIGEITTITDNGTIVQVVCQWEGQSDVTQNSFIFFSKNNLFELKSVLGYYGQATFRNNSFNPAELFATACGIEESSK